MKKNLFLFALIFISIFLISCSATNDVNNDVELPSKEEKESDVIYSVTFIVSEYPEIPGNYIYIMGNFNNWIPGDAEYKLTKNDFDEWEITLEMPKDKIIEYHFNAGSYDSIEKDFFGDELTPRTYKFKYDRDSIYHEIESW